jgi:hypothetical protein
MRFTPRLTSTHPDLQSMRAWSRPLYRPTLSLSRLHFHASFCKVAASEPEAEFGTYLTSFYLSAVIFHHIMSR